jgi:hypothetical protein
MIPLVATVGLERSSEGDRRDDVPAMVTHRDEPECQWQVPEDLAETLIALPCLTDENWQTFELSPSRSAVARVA